MYRVLTVVTLNYELNQLKALPVWDEASGFTLAGTAYDGQRALEMLRNDHYDLVITELSLPLIDGLQLLRHICEEELCPIVVILSNIVDFQYVRECIIYGAFDYIQKMPGTDTMLELFHRAAAQLSQCEPNSSDAKGASFGDISEFQADEALIVQEILNQDPRALLAFRAAIEVLHQVDQAYSVEGDVCVRKFFRSIVNQVFEQMNWLHLYTEADSFHRLDFLWMDHRIHSEDAYAKKLEQLIRLIQELCPGTRDANIQKVVQHVLFHPEGDLQLKHLASEMFVNYSYLSNHFSAQTGINYSHFVARTKMARAAFLLQHSDLHVGEISARLGYRDSDYFSRQFKRKYGLAPKDFRRVNTPQFDYSLL